jgi:hypothetical protein
MMMNQIMVGILQGVLNVVEVEVFDVHGVVHVDHHEFHLFLYKKKLK